MPKQKPQRGQRLPNSKSRPDGFEQEEREVLTFTEIGGSPVPGLTLRHVLRGHTSWIGRIAWSPNGAYLASASDDKTIRIWDTRNGWCVRIVQGHIAAAISVAWSPDGQRLASASDDQTIRLWEGPSGNYVQTLRAHAGATKDVAWSPDGRRLASVSEGTAIYIWATINGKHMQTLEGHTSSPIRALAWSHDGKRLAAASQDLIHVWDVARNKCLRTLEAKATVFDVAWSPDDQCLASACFNTTIILWDIRKSKAIQVLEGHTGSVDCVDFSSNGRWLASKSKDHTVRLWRCDTWACVGVCMESASLFWPPGIAFHPHLPMLATLGERDTIIRIWE